MSHLTALPEVVVKPGNMISYWSSKLKIGAFLFAIALYIYCLLLIKTIYMKSKRLDHVMAMVVDTEKLMSNVHSIDQNLARKLEQGKPGFWACMEVPPLVLSNFTLECMVHVD